MDMRLIIRGGRLYCVRRRMTSPQLSTAQDEPIVISSDSSVEVLLGLDTPTSTDILKDKVGH